MLSPAMRAITKSGRIFGPNFPNLERAYRSGRAIVTNFGDSLSRGQGAGSDGVQLGAYPLCTAARMAKNLALLGGTQGGYSLYGDAPSDTYYVPATTVGSGWASNASFLSPWGTTTVNSTTTNALSVTPAEPFTILEAFSWLEPGASGVYTIKIDGVTVDTVNQVGTQNLVRTQYRVPYGTHTVAFNRVSGAVAIPAFRVFDDTKPCLQFETAAISGLAAYQQAQATGYAISAINAIAKMGTNAIFIDFGGNDKVLGQTAAQFKVSQTLLAQWSKAAGMDVVLVIPVPGDPVDMDAPWRQVFYEVATEQSCQVLDLHALFGTNAIATANGWMTDGYHPNPLGYTILGDAYTRILLGR